MNNMLSIDMGASAFKVASERGTTLTYARVSVPVHHHSAIGHAFGNPLDYYEVSSDLTYCVGRDAHIIGQPVENLDNSRLYGATNTRAVFYLAIYEHLNSQEDENNRRRGGQPVLRLSLNVSLALPLGIWVEEAKPRALMEWVGGQHNFTVRKDGKSTALSLTIRRGIMLPQAAAALYDWAIPDDVFRNEFLASKQPAEARPALTQEDIFRDEFLRQTVAVINIGMNTTEIVISENGQLIPATSHSLPIGVKNYIQLIGLMPGNSFAQIDEKLRSKGLEGNVAMRMAWVDSLLGEIYRAWLDRRRSIDCYLLTGGGVYLLLDDDGKLMPRVQQFLGTNQQIVISDIYSTARGLYKFTRFAETQEGAQR